MRNKTIALLAAGAYAGVCGYLYATQKHHMYRAPRASLGDDEPRIIVPSTTDAPPLLGWMDGKDDGGHAILYFGGVSESVEMRRASFGGAFPDYARYFIPYRGFGPQSHHYPTLRESNLKSDALRTFDELSRRHRSVTVIGRSLGTGIAIHVARYRPVEKMALITPYDSIERITREKVRFPAASLMLRDRWHSFRDAPHVTAKTLALTAERDSIISPARWQSLLRLLPQTATHVAIPDSDHITIAEHPETLRMIADFLVGDARVAAN